MGSKNEPAYMFIYFYSFCENMGSIWLFNEPV